ncbi:hypothetical protein NEUTE2DRAFT_124618 [Neurospora tetrasperma FGSC 2509]|nr:hypothetical protein NEUTE2DRAFT_124618 [Neurospora tetrasperma FGSC 2509]
MRPPGHDQQQDRRGACVKGKSQGPTLRFELQRGWNFGPALACSYPWLRIASTDWHEPPH